MVLFNIKFLRIGMIVTIDRLWLYKIDFNNKVFWTFNWCNYIVECNYNESDYRES
jgi:hypothetical protein